MFNQESAVFQQLASRIADDIVSGTYQPDTAVPSANEYAQFYQMNPATASKSINLLVELGALYKKRGVGMFVAENARETLLAQRRKDFRSEYLVPLLREARIIGMSVKEISEMIELEENAR